MNVNDLNTFCVKYFLCLCSDIDVSTFGNAFPEQQEAVDAIWTSRLEINVDKVLSKDADKLIRLLQQRKYLKKVTFKNPRSMEHFSTVPAAIAGNSSELEVLDIPGVIISQEDARLLSSCVTLKYLCIEYEEESIEFVELLLANNPQLEGVVLGGHVTNTCLKNLPKTIKGIDLRYGSIGELNWFFKYINTWRLEKLSLENMELKRQHVLILSQQTTLKYVNIYFIEVGNALEQLFGNNPGLEEVHLRTKYGITIDGTCFKYLPPSLKCLKVFNELVLDADVFVECVRTWNLESLLIYDFDDDNWVSRVIEAAPSLRELETDMRLLPNEESNYITELEQLKVLSSVDTLDIYFISLNMVYNSCVNLEKLKIDLVSLHFDTEVFRVISELPKLRELCMYENIVPAYWSYSLNPCCIPDLSRSRSLTTVKLIHCNSVKGSDILTFIRGCKTLTNLLIHNCNGIRVDNNFLKKIVLELETQLERTDILSIVFKYCRNVEMNLSTINLHPMLSVEMVDPEFI